MRLDNSAPKPVPGSPGNSPDFLGGRGTAAADDTDGLGRRGLGFSPDPADHMPRRSASSADTAITSSSAPEFSPSPSFEESPDEAPTVVLRGLLNNSPGATEDSPYRRPGEDTPAHHHRFHLPHWHKKDTPAGSTKKDSAPAKPTPSDPTPGSATAGRGGRARRGRDADNSHVGRTVLIGLIVVVLVAVVSVLGYAISRTDTSDALAAPSGPLTLPLTVAELQRDPTKGNAPSIHPNTGIQTISATYLLNDQPDLVVVASRPQTSAKMALTDISAVDISTTGRGACGRIPDNNRTACVVVYQQTAVVAISIGERTRTQLLELTDEVAHHIGT